MVRPRLSWRDRLSRFDLKASPYLYISPFFIVFAVVGLFPLVYTFWVALHRWELLSGQGEFVGLGNFITTLNDGFFWNSILNTVSIFALSTFPQIAVALLLAAILLLAPGPITDTLGLLLLIAPVRRGLRRLLVRQFERMAAAGRLSVRGARLLDDPRLRPFRGPGRRVGPAQRGAHGPPPERSGWRRG